MNPSASKPTSTAIGTLSIVIFGSSGQVGRRLVAEAAQRGHRVTAIARNQPEPGTHPDTVTDLVRDVDRADDLEAIISTHDIVLSALRPREGHEPHMLALTERVVEAAQTAGKRYIVIGGAAPLRMPNNPEHTVLTAPGFLPEAYRPIARASQQQHDWILPQLGALGSYICPPAMLMPGQRTGAYRMDDDTLITDEQGNAQISMEDFAVAVLDEAEHPTHTGRKFTVAY